MVTADDDAEKEPRTPTIEDLVALCRRLNEEEAKYIVVGGMAIIQAGYGRTTEDIDLLIDTSLENEAKVYEALMSACGIDYAAAVSEMQFVDLDGVRIPIASPELLWRMKQTGREKDNLDLVFLRELLGKK